MSILKVCSRCGIEKDKSEFTSAKKLKYGIRNHCNQCRREIYRETHPVHIPQSNRDRYFRAKFKITEAEYEEQLRKQNYVCAICKRPETCLRKGEIKELAVDHCHKTGIKRGLLCQKCNIGLGHFDDDIERMQQAIEYLKSFIA